MPDVTQPTSEATCPWCGTSAPPLPNTEDPDPVHQRRNPLICSDPRCGGYGGYEDWAEDDGLGDMDVFHQAQVSQQSQTDMD